LLIRNTGCLTVVSKGKDKVEDSCGGLFRRNKYSSILGTKGPFSLKKKHKKMLGDGSKSSHNTTPPSSVDGEASGDRDRLSNSGFSQGMTGTFES
jgi:hypothetical protein